MGLQGKEGRKELRTDGWVERKEVWQQCPCMPLSLNDLDNILYAVL